MQVLGPDELARRLLANRRVTDCGYETECWIWTRATVIGGYGQISFRSNGRFRSIRVHRLAAQLWLGFDLCSKLYVLHRCDNPPCFNPSHLFIGTQADNIRDMVGKGRHAFTPQRGEAQTNSKLTEENVRAIRQIVSTEGVHYGTWTGLARRFGVSSTAIYLAATRRTWSHVQ